MVGIAMIKVKRLALFVVFTVTLGLLSTAGCSAEEISLDIPPAPVSALPIDPVFREFYQQLGGEEILGAAISPILKEGFIQCQYTVNALMCYNPQDSGFGRFYLAPLGSQLGISPASEVNATSHNGLVVNGYTVGPDFVDLYQKMSALRQVGNPLSSVVYNYNQQRTEQYFENVGFYHRFDDPPGVAYLLPYGKYTCSDRCSDYPNPVTLAIPKSSNYLGLPFAYTVERLGGERVFGHPLSQAYSNTEGAMEQVYETVVFTSLPGNPEQVKLKPITRLLGMYRLPPAPFNPKQRNVVFYPVTPDLLGYHVPVEFDRFIVQHGGLEVSGNPIADALLYPEENIIRQCYENYCLDYYPDAPEEQKAQLAPLGVRYLKLIDPTVISSGIGLSDKLLVTVSEAWAQLPPGKPQRIYTLVTDETSLKPMAAVVAKLTVTSNGMQNTYALPPTGENGIASIEVAPSPDLPIGTVVGYSVCLDTMPTEAICASASYLIWANE